MSDDYKADILIVDDVVANLRVLEGLLSAEGYKCRVARDGVTAIRAAEAKPPDLIKLDITMPEMDGYEATREIRRVEPEDQHIPIIALTAIAMQGDRKRCLDAGMDDYISKPLHAKKLQETLGKWFDTADDEQVDRKHRVTIVNENLSATEIEKNRKISDEGKN